MQKTSEEGLVRGISRWDLVAIAINGIIGAGIFGLPSKVYALIGTYSLIAFVACAFVVALIILCFAEVGSRFKETGGPYLYAREAFGPTVAFEIGFLIWLARITAFAANCNLLVSYTSYFWPQATNSLWRPTIIVLVVAVLTVINLRGLTQAAMVSNVFTVGKLIPIIVFIAAGLYFINPQSYSLGAAPTTGAFSQSVLLLIYAFTGFEMATIPAGEIRDPKKHLTKAIITALCVVAVHYIHIQLVCVGTLPELAQSTKPLADAGSRFLGTAGGALISAGAVISITGNLNILLLSGSRIPFAMAEQQQLPQIVGKVHQRFFTPHVAIVITAVVMLSLTLTSSFIGALTISAIARLVTYAATCCALPLFRRRDDVPRAEFHLPGGTLIALLSLVLIVWLLANSTLKEAVTAAIVAAVGFVLFLSYRLIHGLRKQPAHRRSSSRL